MLGYVIFFGELAILIVAATFYLKAISKLFQTISVPNRKMNPRLIWLTLIPVFNIVWHFILFHKITQSIEAELYSRKTFQRKQPLYNAGLMTSVSYLLFAGTFFLPVMRFWVLLLFLSSWISYWRKIVEYRKYFEQLPPPELKDSEIFGW